MSSQRTWERRAFAGILKRSEGLDVDLIEGLTIEDGTFVFMLEELSDVEAQRVTRSVEAVKARLEALFNRMKPKDGQVDADDDNETEDAITVAIEEGEEPFDVAGFEAEAVAAGLTPSDLPDEPIVPVAPEVATAPEPVVVEESAPEPVEEEEIPEEDVEPDEGPAAFMEGAPEPAVVPVPTALAHVRAAVQAEAAATTE